MGNKASQEDEEHLLEDEGIEPIFEELRLVLIGIQGAGKNKIGNAIFREKVFTFWTSYKSDYVKETRRVSGTQIHLARTPGWRGELRRSEKTKREIVHCVQSLYNTGPHAVLLALKVNSELSESTIRTLESLLTEKLWDHTIVIFTNGEKLGHCNIEDHIISTELKSLIKKCGERYFVIEKNDGKQITDKIEELIVRKNSTTCFELSDQTEGDVKKLSDWKCLVERTKSKIASILEAKKRQEKLLINPKKQNKDSLKELLDSKDEKIRELNIIIEEKEKEIKRLESIHLRTQDPDLIDLTRRVAELEEKLHMKNKELMECYEEKKAMEKKEKEKDTVIEELKKELQMLQEKAIDWRTHKDQYAHAGYHSELGQDATMVNSRRHTKIPLQNIPSNGCVQHNWSHTLLQILNKLLADELKTMKYYLKWNEEYRIPMSSIEGTNRVELADSILKQWGERQSVLKTRDLMKKIPRNDEVMKELFAPFLRDIGETW